MAHPARALDPFTLRTVRKQEHKVSLILSVLELECDKLRKMIAPFNKTVLSDDYDDIAIELLEKWLKQIRSALTTGH